MPEQRTGRAARGNCQSNWRWCSKCDTLHYIGKGLGICPAGGTHGTGGSGAYVVINNDPSIPFAVQGWRLCNKCYALYFPEGADHGDCPAGGSHDSTGSANYCLISKCAADLGQTEWSRCTKCRMMFYKGSAPHGVCPEGGQHTGALFVNYEMLRESDLPIVGGYVVDSEDDFVSGAKVQLIGKGARRNTTTMSHGTYSFKKVVAHKNTVNASKDGVGNGKLDIKVKKADAKAAVIQLK